MKCSCLKLINSDSDDSIDVDNKSDKNRLEYGPSDKKGAECKLCLGTADKNKIGSVEPLIHCSKCLTICKSNLLNQNIVFILNYVLKKYIYYIIDIRSSNMFGYDIGNDSLH